MLLREEKYIQEWEAKRSKGKWNYVLLTALVWGSLIPAVIAAFRLAFKGQLSFSNFFDTIFDIDFFPTWIKFVVGFFFFALLMWYLAKRKYLALKRKQMTQNQLRVPIDDNPLV